MRAAFGLFLLPLVARLAVAAAAVEADLLTAAVVTPDAERIGLRVEFVVHLLVAGGRAAVLLAPEVLRERQRQAVAVNRVPAALVVEVRGRAAVGCHLHDADEL